MKHLDPANTPTIDSLWSFISPSFKKYQKKTAWLVREGKKQKRKISYGDLEKASLTIAALLRAEGVGEGDTVGVTAPNGPEWSAATLAAWKVGAMVAPIHIGNSDAEIKAQVEAIDQVCLHHGLRGSPRGRVGNVEGYLPAGLQIDF